tara:strand:- start:871 stop:1890 length:1020 start_codon:yes stop_codon:yes gene_type:complete
VWLILSSLPIKYPRRVSLAQLPTPLQPVERLVIANTRAPRIWIKRDDLTGAALSGNKVRKLEFILAAVQDAECDTVITSGGLQSNHCRATSLACAKLGLNAHLILRGEKQEIADGNLLLDYLSGAEVSCYSIKEYQQSLDSLFDYWLDHYESIGRKPFKVPTGASDGIGLWGYIAAAEELKNDVFRLNINPGAIVCATGSGGTQGGLMVGAEIHQLGCKVWGINVCDDERYFVDKVHEDIIDWQDRYPLGYKCEDIKVNIIDGYVGSGYAKAAPEIFETIAKVASTEGIVFDPVYTGKAFHGLIQELEAGRFDDCEDLIFVHTGGLFGLFPQKNQIIYP